MMPHSLIKLILRQISKEGVGLAFQDLTMKREMIHKNLIDYAQPDMMQKMNLGMIPNKANTVFK